MYTVGDRVAVLDYDTHEFLGFGYIEHIGDWYCVHMDQAALVGMSKLFVNEENLMREENYLGLE